MWVLRRRPLQSQAVWQQQFTQLYSLPDKAGMNLRDKILKSNDRPLTTHFIPEWDCTVHLRPFSGAERFEIEAWASKGAEGLLQQRRWREQLIVKAVVDSEGVQVFSEKDLDQLAEKNSNVL